ncbi:Putative methyltransferase C9orf114 [Linum perenne]
MGKKKKRAELEPEAEELTVSADNNEIVHEFANGDSNKKKKKKKAKNVEKETVDETVKEDANEHKEMPTVSIAVSGSIIDNAQSLELATRLASQIARAATIFRIDEIVVFDNQATATNEDPTTTMSSSSDDNESGAAFLVRILRYLETPQYLRKALFPKHNSLRFVGMLPPLDAPHHLRKHEWGPFREGVTLNEKCPDPAGTLVDVGLTKNVSIDQRLEAGTRVTVAMGTDRNLDSVTLRPVVSLSKPREEAGMYWGYRVRYASNISAVFKYCPFKGGYDRSIGTSEHGLKVSSSELSLDPFKHLLIAFGGLAGLEEGVEEDSSLKGKNVRAVFDSYLNTCPNQGSRTIRTEEAILISLQYFQEPINRALQRCT